MFISRGISGWHNELNNYLAEDIQVRWSQLSIKDSMSFNSPQTHSKSEAVMLLKYISCQTHCCHLPSICWCNFKMKSQKLKQCSTFDHVLEQHAICKPLSDKIVCTWEWAFQQFTNIANFRIIKAYCSNNLCITTAVLQQVISSNAWSQTRCTANSKLNFKILRRNSIVMVIMS